MKENIDELVDKEIESIMSEYTFEVEINEDLDIPVYKSTSDNKKKILILSGGSIKGIAHIGAIKALEDKGLLDNIEIMAGSSVGALFLGLYYIGYTPAEIFEFVYSFDLDKLKSIDFVNLLDSYGLDKGNNFNYVVKRLISAKGYKEDVTLGELYTKLNKELVICAVCWNDCTPHYFNHETAWDLPLYSAIRKSVSIPGLFTPDSYNGELFIDGAMMDNYPIDRFKDRLHEVIGIYLLEKSEYISKVENYEHYFWRLFNCFTHGTHMMKIKTYQDQTIVINLPSVNIINFGVDKETKKKFLDIGYETVQNSLRSKNFIP